MSSLTNVTFDEVKVGQSMTVSRTLSKADIEALAFTSGDVDAYHLEDGESGEPGTSTDRAFRYSNSDTTSAQAPSWCRMLHTAPR